MLSINTEKKEILGNFFHPACTDRRRVIVQTTISSLLSSAVPYACSIATQ